MIGVGGCVASQEGAAIVARAPYVDVVFGPQTLHRLPAADRGAPRAPAGRRSTSRFPEIEKFDHLPPARVDGATAFVSIMEGCSKYCSFCVVPYTRGEEVSRPFDDVLDRNRRTRRAGREGSHPARPERQRLARRACDDGDIADFALLLEYVAEIPGIERIRYTTSHPQEFTPAPDRRLRAHAASWSSHVHLPVQSGSDRVLAAMKRGYTALEYKSIIRRLRAARPDISLSVRLHRRLSRARPSRFRGDHEAGRRTSASTTVSASSTARAPARRRRSWPTTRRRR